MSLHRGPRKQSLYAGLYATDGLGEVQPAKHGHFSKTKRCFKNRHTWIKGLYNWVCTRCGHVASLKNWENYPPPPDN